MHLFSPWLALSLALSTVNAIQININSADSVSTAMSDIAYGMMKYYTGNETGANIGQLPAPYYWWEAGAMFGTMIEYWYYTGDTTYNDEVSQAISFQAGPNGDFMPANQTKDEGNDDQVFWAFAAMTAAELGFPNPTSGPSWLSMAQAVFNEQIARWDTSTCGGGLRWQIFAFNGGYTYKNVASNGGLMQLGARLGRYTGNQTYIDWSETAWNWFETSVLYDPSTSQIYDGTSDVTNCTTADHIQWTYNYGFYIAGLSYMYNHTEDAKWLTPLTSILTQTFETFAPASNNKILMEVACEPLGNCDSDNFCFKGFLARWLALATQLAPTTAATINPYLQANGQGAAGQCDGGSDGMTCGFRWNTTTWDGLYGVGEQMSALSAVGANMLQLKELAAPLTANTGGTSKSDPSAGTGNQNARPDLPSVATRPITTGDKAGAAIVTILVVIFMVGGAAWMLFFD